MSSIICAASDCENSIADKFYNAKYCSKRCRWREFSRKRREERKGTGKCLQCGNEMKQESERSYCEKCKVYFRERYYAQK